jgi:hypothetical protein
MKMEVVPTAAMEGGSGEEETSLVQREEERLRAFPFFL